MDDNAHLCGSVDVLWGLRGACVWWSSHFTKQLVKNGAWRRQPRRFCFLYSHLAHGGVLSYRVRSRVTLLRRRRTARRPTRASCVSVDASPILCGGGSSYQDVVLVDTDSLR